MMVDLLCRKKTPESKCMDNLLLVLSLLSEPSLPGKRPSAVTRINRRLTVVKTLCVSPESWAGVQGVTGRTIGCGDQAVLPAPPRHGLDHTILHGLPTVPSQALHRWVVQYIR